MNEKRDVCRKRYGKRSELMTESEFQEFMIIMGYRYHEKSKTAFNSFEGFHNLIEFSEKENRYSLALDCIPKGAEQLRQVREQLRAFHTEHKNHVLRSGYDKKRLYIVMKMTIDSDIDKEELKALVHFMTELFKSGELSPICRICSRERKTGLYVVGKEVTAMCEACVGRKRRLYEKRKNVFLNKTQHLGGGLAGALFGGAMGSAVYVLLYQLFPMFGVGSLLIVLLSFLGFVVTGSRATKKSAVICELISAVMFLLSEYIALVLSSAIEIERLGGGIAVSEAIDITNTSLCDGGYVLSLLPELLIGLGMMAAAGIAYFLKRKYTRPMKISKNIL